MLQLQTLGAVDLRQDGEELRRILLQPKRLALLAYLATATPRGFHSRDTLLGLFWPELGPERARNALRQALHFLRRELGDDTLPGRGDREVGIAPGALWCDAAAFDELLAAGRLDDAVTLYRGDFLPGFFIEEAPEAERWLEAERERRRQAVREALVRLGEREEAAGDLRAAALWARRGVALAPADEAIARRLMATLDRAGQPAGALEVYDQLLRRLREEFGVAPSAETIGLVKAIRARTGASGPGPSAEAATTTTDAEAILAPAPEPAAHQGVERPAEEPALPATRAAPRPGASRRWAAAILALALASAGWFAVSRPAAPAHGAAPRAIAVLPFLNLSGTEELDYLSDGFAEELLNTLARVDGLRVAARTSAFRFKGQQVPPDSIGRALRVGHVIEGSVRRDGDRLRVTAQLVDAASGFQVWSESYDGRMGELLAMQAVIGRAVAARLRGEAPVAAAGEPESSDPEAITLLLRARQLSRSSRSPSREQVALLEEAIRRDPRYARAHAQLGVTLAFQAYYREASAEDTYRRARDEAERALALREVPEAHLVLGRLADVRDRDYAAAERHYAQAIALNPSGAGAYMLRARLLLRLRRPDEAIAAARAAVALDPLSTGAHATLASVYAMLDRHAEALPEYRAALALAPGDPVILGNYSMSQAATGDHQGALASITAARTARPDLSSLEAYEAWNDAKAGRRADAEAKLARLDAGGRTSRMLLASVHVVLGNHDAALRQLERALAERDDYLNDLAITPEFASLRDDARFQRIVAASQR